MHHDEGVDGGRAIDEIVQHHRQYMHVYRHFLLHLIFIILHDGDCFHSQSRIVRAGGVQWRANTMASRAHQK